MGWRENMGVKKTKSQEQKPQKEQKPPEQPPFATIAPFATVNPKTKTNPEPLPDLSKIQPEDRAEYTSLWRQAWELEGYTSSEAPYPERVAKLPELNRMVERMRIIEGRLKPGTPSQTKKVPGIPGGWMPNPNHQDQDTCRACGENA